MEDLSRLLMHRLVILVFKQIQLKAKLVTSSYISLWCWAFIFQLFVLLLLPAFVNIFFLMYILTFPINIIKGPGAKRLKPPSVLWPCLPSTLHFLSAFLTDKTNHSHVQPPCSISWPLPAWFCVRVYFYLQIRKKNLSLVFFPFLHQ